MAQELINIGITADDGTGDTIRGAGIKINNNFTELYATSSASSQIHFIGNNISSTLSNSDIALAGNGTGIVKISDLTIDGSIRMSDNEIRTNTSNADLVLTASGTGTIQTSVADINGGAIDGTVIGATTPAAATFSTLSYNNSALVIDGVTVNDNTISANASNSDLELSGNGTGYVNINGVSFPNSDGTAGQVLQTDGNGQLAWFTSPILFDSTSIDDGTATLTGDSTTQNIDSFSTSTYRSAKYHIQISDTTADRYKLVEANITHDGSTAFISITGGASNGAGDGSTIYDSLDLSADINSGNVRLRGTVNNTNTQVVKFVRRIVKV
jgi:hypothetical protein